MNKKEKSIFITVCAIVCVLSIVVLLISSCSHTATNVDTIKDYGTAYRVVDVVSGGKSIWKFKGTIKVEVDGETTIVTTKDNKKHIFINADVIIRESTKETESGKSTKDASKAETSKAETSKAKTSKPETSKVETSNSETSKVETSKSHTSRIETSKNEVSTVEQSSNVSGASGITSRT